jgi:hypothetical protein
MKRKVIKYIVMSVLLLICLVALLSTAGCTRIIYQPVPEYHYEHDTIKHTVMRDSIVYRDREVRDSASFRKDGDTILIEKWHWERDYKYEKYLQAQIDSLSNVKRDSIPYPVPGPTEYVPAELTALQQFWIVSGKVGIVLLIVTFVILYIKTKT